jgi:hypothetical protein
MIPDSMTTPRSRLGRGASRFAERRIRDALSTVGVTVNGHRPWDPQIHDSRFYRRLMWQGSLGLGESYVEGWWDVEELDRFFEHLLIARDPRRHGFANEIATRTRAHFFNLQTRRRAFRAAEAHYDLGNDLFVAMLDPRMIYTCADWRGVTTLAEAVPPQNPVDRTIVEVSSFGIKLTYPVHPQNPVNGAIVDVSALGVELAYPDASLAVPPARNRQIEPEAAARTR